MLAARAQIQQLPRRFAEAAAALATTSLETPLEHISTVSREQVTIMLLSRAPHTLSSIDLRKGSTYGKNPDLEVAFDANSLSKLQADRRLTHGGQHGTAREVEPDSTLYPELDVPCEQQLILA